MRQIPFTSSLFSLGIDTSLLPSPKDYSLLLSNFSLLSFILYLSFHYDFSPSFPCIVLLPSRPHFFNLIKFSIISSFEAVFSCPHLLNALFFSPRKSLFISPSSKQLQSPSLLLSLLPLSVNITPFILPSKYPLHPSPSPLRTCLPSSQDAARTLSSPLAALQVLGRFHPLSLTPAHPRKPTTRAAGSGGEGQVGGRVRGGWQVGGRAERAAGRAREGGRHQQRPVITVSTITKICAWLGALAGPGTICQYDRYRPVQH